MGALTSLSAINRQGVLHTPRDAITMLMLLLLLRRASPFVRTTGARPARCIHAAAVDAWRACDACVWWASLACPWPFPSQPRARAQPHAQTQP